MKEHGKSSSEPAPATEVTEILSKLKCWTLAENGRVLEGRYPVPDQSAGLRFIAQATYLAFWQGWPLTKIGYRDCRILFRLGDPKQAGVTRDHLLQATAIHGFSLPGRTPSDPRVYAGGDSEDHPAMFEKFRSLSSADLKRALSSHGSTSSASATGSGFFNNNPATARHQLNATLSAIMAEHPWALQVAERSLISACRLAPDQVPAVLVVDYISDAWSQVSLAAALSGDLQRARIAVRLAERIQTEGSGDPETAALTLMARAAGLAPSDPQAALESVVQAQSLLTEIGGSSLLGWTLIRKGLLLLELNLRAAAADALQEGLRRTDPSIQPALFQRAHKSLEQIELEAPSNSSKPGSTNGEDLTN